MKTTMSLKRAATINAVSRFGKIFIQLIVNAILARLLSPYEFGIVTIITVFTTFFNTFADMGFGSAVIQNKKLSREDIDHIYSFTVYMGIILSIAFWIFCIPISSFYHSNVYFKMGPLLSLSLLFNAINMVPNAVLMREKKFVVVAIRTIVVYLLGGILAVFLATMKYSYYALVIQTVFIAMVSFLWNYLGAHLKFHLIINFNSIRKVAQFSFFQFSFNLINYFSRNLDNLLAGKFFGSAALSYYDKAYQLMLYPVNNLTGVITPVLHPILSDFQDQRQRMYRSYIKVIRILGSIGAYASAVCFLASTEIIGIVYGPQWHASVVCFEALGLVIGFQMINSATGSIFQALGNTRLLFISGLINTILTVFFIALGIFWGKNVIWLSIAVSLAYFLQFLTAQYILVVRGFRYKMSAFWNDLRNFIFLYGGLIISTIFYPWTISNLFVSLIVKVVWISFWSVFIIILTGQFHEYTKFIRRK